MPLPRTIGPYNILKLLGRGGFSKVVLAQHTTTGRTVAIKVVAKSRIASSETERRVFTTELDILRKADHPLIISLFDYIEDDLNHYLVLEFVEKGSLLQFLNDNSRLLPLQVSELLGQLVCAFDYLHNELHVAHRDVKVENILFDRNMNVRVIDFGLSKADVGENSLLVTRCGSCAYASPEVLVGQPYTQKADIWSLGIVIYTALVGHVPFLGESEQTTIEQIVKAQLKFPPFVDPEWANLISQMLRKDPDERITIAELKEHELVKQFLPPNPITTFSEVIESQNPNRSQILQDIAEGRFTPASVSYRILRRDRMNAQMGKSSLSGVLPLLRRVSAAKSPNSKILVKSLALHRHCTDIRSVPPTRAMGFGHAPLIPLVRARGPSLDTLSQRLTPGH